MSTAKLFWSGPTDWAWLDALRGAVDQDFEEAVNEKSLEQVRPELDVFA